jgi:hypothetical protein
MTAEVAILNTHGVAIAADSAISIGLGWGEKKIYYTAEKIFCLSGNKPIGIMVYSNAEFMGISWEIIINEYSKEPKNNELKGLEDYCNNLLQFISDFKYITVEKEISYLRNICGRTYWYIKNCFDEEIKKYSDNNLNISEADSLKIFDSIIDRHLKEVSESDTIYEEYVDDNFLEENIEIVFEGLQEIFKGRVISGSQKEKLFQIIKLNIKKLETKNLYVYTGLILTGYGDNDIYPSVCNIRLFGRLGKNLIHQKYAILKIEDEDEAIIYPVAQTDVIYTFTRGIDPSFERQWKEKLDDFTQKILELTENEKSNEITKLKEKLIEEMNDYLEENYRGPIFKIVGSLPRINLTEMAEALINITSLRRHVSTDSESVGGPTDVAVISKVDGFIWVKRKNYFDKQKNGT